MKKKMKKRYRMSTGLHEIKERPLFSTDKEAWEYLRKKFETPRYATLYREEIVDVPIINRAVYLKLYNAKYTTQKIEKQNNHIYWVPVCDGITSHQYRGLLTAQDKKEKV